ncbi:MAG: iron ABC transporter permease [Oscillospiraceae bacterium]|nr:iron ABC transporter permease [Oscillospiraceae bacterium]
MALPTAKTKAFCAAGAALLLALAVCSLLVGKYPLSLQKLISGDELQRRVFWTLRFSRTVVGVVGGFALGTAGFVYQTVFRNPLASPDIIGVSSGASAGAAAGILFLSGTAAVTVSAFAGAVLAVAAALALSRLDKSGRSSTVVLAGIAVHALAQTALMCLKLMADPERQLASIEYWIMGSLSGISSSIGGNLTLCAVCLVGLFLLHRQILLLSAEEGEARMLGVQVGRLRLLVLLTATLAVSCVVSLSGLISFVGLLAPHGARLLTKNNRIGTMLLSGLLGGALLCGADILARSVGSSELPVSIFTSLLGAPLLIMLVVRGRKSL